MLSKIKILTIGKIKEKYIQIGINEFVKRIGAFCNIEIIELKDRGILEDSENILEFIKKQNTNNIFILDDRGDEYCSIDFAGFIKNLSENCIFIIGGHDGIIKEVKEKNKLISLSKMTLTHEMARLFLLEQLYRSFMIINNKGYYNK